MRSATECSTVVRIERETFPLKEPFSFTGITMVDSAVVTVTLEANGSIGRGEASGVYYRKDEDASSIAQQLEAMRRRIETGLSRASLHDRMPSGGARNALDCALWDLEAKLTGQPVWQLAGLDRPRALITAYTIGAGTVDTMANRARGLSDARALKIKLTGHPVDADRVRAVRSARPDTWLGVDANQGFTPEGLLALLPVLVESGVKLIEQPFPVGQEAWLNGLNSPIPIAADESLQGLDDLQKLAGRVAVVNIKLDKCGGLTEALMIARAAPAYGFEVMVGNMVGTSLAMAPAFLVGQLCRVVDLDGPTFLSVDRSSPVRYSGGYISCPDSLWGSPAAQSAVQTAPRQAS